MAVDIREVEKIADLARLKFKPEELERFVPQFQEILDYFVQLEAVPTESVRPMYHALLQDHPETPMREDEVQKSLRAEVAVANAPDSADEQFRVPRVID